MEGANENSRVAQEPHRPGARLRRYCYQPEPGIPSRPAKPDRLTDDDAADLRRRMPQLARASASLRRSGFPWTGRCTARVSIASYGRNCSLFSAGTDSLFTRCSNISLCYSLLGLLNPARTFWLPTPRDKKISGIPAIGWFSLPHKFSYCFCNLFCDFFIRYFYLHFNVP